MSALKIYPRLCAAELKGSQRMQKAIVKDDKFQPCKYKTYFFWSEKICNCVWSNSCISNVEILYSRRVVGIDMRTYITVPGGLLLSFFTTTKYPNIGTRCFASEKVSASSLPFKGMVGDVRWAKRDRTVEEEESAIFFSSFENMHLFIYSTV